MDPIWNFPYFFLNPSLSHFAFRNFRTSNMHLDVIRSDGNLEQYTTLLYSWHGHDAVHIVHNMCNDCKVKMPQRLSVINEMNFKVYSWSQSSSTLDERLHYDWNNWFMVSWRWRWTICQHYPSSALKKAVTNERFAIWHIVHPSQLAGLIMQALYSYLTQ